MTSKLEQLTEAIHRGKIRSHREPPIRPTETVKAKILTHPLP